LIFSVELAVFCEHTPLREHSLLAQNNAGNIIKQGTHCP
jgi:hypothetical protein